MTDMDGRKVIRGMLVGLAVLSACLVLVAPPLPQWGVWHAPHDKERWQELRQGQEISQTFQFEYPVLDALVLWLDVSRGQLPDGYLQVVVERKDDQREVSLPLSDVASDGLAYIPLTEPLRAAVGESAVFHITLHDASAPVRFRYQIDATKYEGGEMRHSQRNVQGDLAFQLHYLRPALGSWRMQIGYGLALLLAAAIVGMGMRERLWVISYDRRDILVACLLGASIAALYAFFLVRPGIWLGPGDFSKDVSYVQAGSEAFSYGRWPVWSHVMCGGLLALGNPENNALSVASLLALVMSAEKALWIMLAFEAGIGAVGVYVLARSFGVSRLGSVTGSIVALVSAAYPYRIVEGFSMIGAAVAYVPWVFLGVLQVWRNKGVGWAIVSGLGLTCMLWRGEVHILTGVLLVLGCMAAGMAISQKSVKPLRYILFIGAFFFLAGSAKVLPYLEDPAFFSHAYRPYVTPLLTAGLLDDVFLQVHDRFYPVDVKYGKFAEEWGNFGSYIGWGALILFAVGLWRKVDRWWLVLLLGLLLALVLIEGTLFDAVLRHMGPLAGLLRLPIRLVVVVLALAAPIVGNGVDRIMSVGGKRWGLALGVGIIAIVTGDLLWAQTKVFTSHLKPRWQSESTLVQSPQLAFHRNAGFDDARHPSVLLAQGYMVPALCADVIAPPSFAKKAEEEVLPLSSVPTALEPNVIVLQELQGPSVVEVKERFSSRWVSSVGIVREGSLGQILLYVPDQYRGDARLQFTDALTKPQQVLVLFGMLTAGYLAFARLKIKE